MPSRPPVHRPAYLPTPEQTRREYDARRGSPSARGYGRDWQRVRAAKLAEEPLCRFCMARGQVVEANEVHHKEPVSKRPDLRLSMSNLISLCKSCHSITERRGIKVL